MQGCLSVSTTQGCPQSDALEARV